MKEIDVEAVRAEALAANCQGIVKLIDFIQTELKAGRKIVKIGSATIDFHGQVKALEAREHSHEELRSLIDSLPYFHFGRADQARTPMEDIADLVEQIAEVPQNKRTKIDRLCDELAGYEEDRDFEIITGKLILCQPLQ